MPNRCVVGGCSKTSKDGVHLHAFPKDERNRRLWTRFVQNTRSDFKHATQTSVICSGHFSEDCYDPSFQIKESLGIKCKRTILPGKYPTIKVGPSGASEDKNTVGKTVEEPNVTGPTSSSTSTTGSTSGQKRTLGWRVKSTPQDEPGLTKRQRFSSERRSQKNMVEEIVAAYDRKNEVCQTPDELLSEVT